MARPNPKPRKLTPQEYQAFKKERQDIQLDSRLAMQNDWPSSFIPSRDEYVEQMQQEARFMEARMQALRARFGLPRKIDYYPSR